jgi:hypothetical protein
MIYQAGLSFNFFEKPEVLAFLRFINSAYVPLKRSYLATISPAGTGGYLLAQNFQLKYS